MKSGVSYVYLSGPIKGLAYGESTNWRKTFADGLPEDIFALSPMRGKDYLSDEEVISESYENIPLSSQHGIVTRDRNDVSRCDVVVGYLARSQEVSIGTVFEYAWAYLLRKPTVTIVNDSIWNGNVHNHPFMREATDFLVGDIPEAIHIVELLIGNKYS